MSAIKSLIKKYFTSFTFFYRQNGNKIFIIVALSLFVSILDGFGLSMFLPLLQMVGNNGEISAEGLGNLSFLVDALEAFNINLTITTILIVMVIFFILKGLVTYIKEIYNVIVQHSFIRNLRLTLIGSLDRMNFKKFITSDAGKIQNTISGEVDRVSMSFQFYFNTFQQAIMVLVYVVFAFFVDWKFAILVAAGGFITNLLFKIIYSRTKDASIKLVNSGHTYQGLLLQHVSNYKYLKATGQINQHSDKLKSSIFAIEDFRRKMGKLSAIGIALREPLLIIVIAIVIVVQIKFLGGEISGILISLLFFYRALASLMGMQQSWNSFLTVSGSLQNMQEFEKELNGIKETDGSEKFVGLQNQILCKNLSFSFGEVSILKDIQLEIKKNQSVAFVGESGSGKTTLVNTIAGLLDVGSGDILIDATPIKKLQKQSFQRKIGYITQEPVIFNDTVYNNVSFWAEKSPENIARFNRAIQQAALSDLIDGLENGKETYLGNNGINISGGQKQRISIARELFKDIDILIMDEATSALDSETETYIQQSIEQLKGNYTLIVIAHRLSTVRNVDKVVFMHKGVIEKEGSFEELVETFPKFKKMVELQGIGTN